MLDQVTKALLALALVTCLRHPKAEELPSPIQHPPTCQTNKNWGDSVPRQHRATHLLSLLGDVCMSELKEMERAEAKRSIGEGRPEVYREEG